MWINISGCKIRIKLTQNYYDAAVLPVEVAKYVQGAIELAGYGAVSLRWVRNNEYSLMLGSCFIKSYVR